MASAQQRGKVFEGELKRSMEEAGVLVHRIRDGRVAAGYGQAMGLKNPCDFYAWAVSGERLVAVAIEAKAVGVPRLPFENVQPHQVEALAQFDLLHKDMKAYIAVNFYDTNSIRKLNRCFMLPIADYEEALQGDAKSVPLAYFEERAVECPRMKGQLYDMSGWRDSLWR